ncbi:MAG TPA: C4-dicarboxylate ABC transporter [Peptococcaceae bacterium]|nr:C4-dicarboxylate ABC transporter [Peptococcaceae bacterium]
MKEKHLIKYLAPGWFAVIMGTGGLANILFLWQDSFPLGQFLGLVLAALAGVLYFLVLVPWLIRWVKYYEYVRRDLHHPISVNFFVTMPVATTIIGTNIYFIWSRYLSLKTSYCLAFLAYLIAIAGVTYFTFYTTFRLMRVEDPPQPETMNFSWIMAPIANMAVLLIGNPVLALTIKLRPEWAMTVLITNISLLGIGFFLFIFISAIIFVRLAQFPLPPAELTPSFGIFLSAIGLAVSAVIDTSKNAQVMGLLNTTDFSYLMAACIWGFGIWIVGIIFIICLHHLRRGGIPFNLGWWAFIFPLAAYTIASQKIALYFLSPLVTGYTIFLTILLFGLWLLTFINTALGVLKGTLFVGTPITKKQ